MVPPDSTRRPNAGYSLDRIRELAKSGQVTYATRRVYYDTENYGYTPEEVQCCLHALKMEHFRHAEMYNDSGPLLDVYHCQWRAPDGSGIDPLYIKLRLNKNCTRVLLFSFHRDR